MKRHQVTLVICAALVVAAIVLTILEPTPVSFSAVGVSVLSLATLWRRGPPG